MCLMLGAHFLGRYMQSLSDLAKQLDTGLLWENCHGTVAPGT